MAYPDGLLQSLEQALIEAGALDGASSATAKITNESFGKVNIVLTDDQPTLTGGG